MGTCSPRHHASKRTYARARTRPIQIMWGRPLWSANCSADHKGRHYNTQRPARHMHTGRPNENVSERRPRISAACFASRDLPRVEMPFERQSS
jgi:hypothetical protein